MTAFSNSLCAILFIAAFSFNASAQLPDSIAITTNGSWIIEHSETTYGWNPQLNAYTYNTTNSYKYYRSGPDTLINVTPYTQLLFTYLNKNTDGTFSPAGVASEIYHFAYRNDNDRRCFRIPNSSSTEELWYDFNLDVGDTIWNPVTIGDHPYLTVSAIDSIDYCDSSYANYHFNEVANHYSSIQRIGSTINFLNNYGTAFTADKIIYFCEESVSVGTVAGVESFESLESIQL